MVLPFILSSGLPPVNDMDQLPALNIQALVTKPCTLAVLLQTVKSVLCEAAGQGATPGLRAPLSPGQMD